MSDLIERLKAADQYFCGRDHEIFMDAHDEIKRLRAALERIIAVETHWLTDDGDAVVMRKIAREALEGKQEWWECSRCGALSMHWTDKQNEICECVNCDG